MSTITDNTIIELAYDIALIRPGRWTTVDFAGVYCELEHRALSAARNYNITNHESYREDFLRLDAARHALRYSEHFDIDEGAGDGFYVSTTRGDLPVRVFCKNRKWKFLIVK